MADDVAERGVVGDRESDEGALAAEFHVWLWRVLEKKICNLLVVDEFGLFFE